MIDDKTSSSKLERYLDEIISIKNKIESERLVNHPGTNPASQDGYAVMQELQLAATLLSKVSKNIPFDPDVDRRISKKFYEGMGALGRASMKLEDLGWRDLEREVNDLSNNIELEIDTENKRISKVSERVRGLGDVEVLVDGSDNISKAFDNLDVSVVNSKLKVGPRRGFSLELDVEAPAEIMVEDVELELYASVSYDVEIEYKSSRSGKALYKIKFTRS